MLEEKVVDESKEPSKFFGYEDSLYQSGPDGSANYAFLIFDPKTNSFNITPLEKHYKFEKHVDYDKNKKKDIENEKKSLMPKVSKI